jgi:hypothetical protein
MRKKMVFAVMFILAGAFLFGCGPKPGYQTGWERTPADMKFYVYGRVTNFATLPVENCKVVLIKRTVKPETASAPKAGQGASQIEFLVATSSRAGDYDFEFRPGEVYDCWLYFDATSQGYAAQTVPLQYKWSNVGVGYGRTPISMNIILEPTRQ